MDFLQSAARGWWTQRCRNLQCRPYCDNTNPYMERYIVPDQGTGGLLSPYLRRERFRAVIPLIRGGVLDFGCGVGELARYCDHSRYWGVDHDSEALEIARARFPQCRFSNELPVSEKFDTIVGLAVIEHMKEPEELLRRLRGLMADGGRLVLTTPHPSYRRVHDLGARLGIFSLEASEEHEMFFDKDSLRETAVRAGLNLASVQRFLCGANQLFVLTRP